MNSLICMLSKDAFYHAKEIETILYHTHWTEHERIHGRKCHCSISTEDMTMFSKYFKYVGFDVDFVMSHNDVRFTSAAYFIPRCYV